MTQRLFYNNRNLSVYIDTNVLRNFFTGQTADVECLRFIFSIRRKEKLFTSTLAVVQALSGLQKSNRNRKGFTKEKIIEISKYISQKISLIDFFESDFYKGIALESEDVEDNIHYFLGQKKNCNLIITNDTKGFSNFYNIIALKPTQLSYLRNLIG